MRSVLFVFFSAALTVAQDGPKDEKVKDALKKLDGAWVVESSVIDGEGQGSDLGLEFIFGGDKLIVQNPRDGKMEKHTCKVDPSVSPMAIDLIRAEDKYVFKYIYEIKGNQLRLCLWKAQPEQRATEFKDGEGHALMVLKRPKS